jgi:hypothetical protein
VVEATRRRAWAATLAAVATAVAGCSASSGSSGAAGVPPPAARSVAESVAPTGGKGAGPTTIVAGVPMGYSHDAAGAAAAALGFTRFNEVLVDMGEAEATQALGVMAASGSDDLVQKTRGDLARVQARWPAGTLSYRVAPMGVSVHTDGPYAADVRVWYVGVVAADNAPTYEDWATDRYRLVWEDDDWRVEGFSTDPGPRPSVARPTAPDAAASQAAVAGLDRVP